MVPIQNPCRFAWRFGSRTSLKQAALNNRLLLEGFCFIFANSLFETLQDFCRQKRGTRLKSGLPPQTSIVVPAVTVAPDNRLSTDTRVGCCAWMCIEYSVFKEQTSAFITQFLYYYNKKIQSGDKFIARSCQLLATSC